MSRQETMVVAVAMLVALAVVPFGAVATLATDGAQTDGSTAEPDGNASVAPGERLAGVVGVQQAEIDGEVTDRAYGLQIANAATEEAKAEVVADRFAEIEGRLAAHEERLASLRAERQAGELSDGAFRAKVATVNAERASTERLANRTNETAAELPTEVLESNGVNVSAIQTLRERADQLGGQEVAAIARSIAGNADGHPVFGDDRPGDGSDGRPAVPGNGSDDRPGVPGNGSDDRPADNETAGEDSARDRASNADRDVSAPDR